LTVVAVVAAIIRDEIKPAKIWLPAKKISRSYQTKTKRRRGEKMFAESQTLTK
jgi:hypothetical protein